MFSYLGIHGYSDEGEACMAYILILDDLRMVTVTWESTDTMPGRLNGIYTYSPWDDPRMVKVTWESIWRHSRTQLALIQIYMYQRMDTLSIPMLPRQSWDGSNHCIIMIWREIASRQQLYPRSKVVCASWLRLHLSALNKSNSGKRTFHWKGTKRSQAA